MTIKFLIKAELFNGTIMECFHWCRDEDSGIRRAYADAAQFGIILKRVWAEDASASGGRL